MAPAVALAARQRIAPFDGGAFVEGLLVGIGSVFMPALEESDSGVEAAAKFQQCMSVKHLHTEFFLPIKEAFQVWCCAPLAMNGDDEPRQAPVNTNPPPPFFFHPSFLVYVGGAAAHEQRATD